MKSFPPHHPTDRQISLVWLFVALFGHWADLLRRPCVGPLMRLVHSRIELLNRLIRAFCTIFFKIRRIIAFRKARKTFQLTKFLLTSSCAFSAFLSPRSNVLRASSAFSASLRAFNSTRWIEIRKFHSQSPQFDSLLTFTSSAGLFWDFPNSGMVKGFWDVVSWLNSNLIYEFDKEFLSSLKFWGVQERKSTDKVNLHILLDLLSTGSTEF